MQLFDTRKKRSLWLMFIWLLVPLIMFIAPYAWWSSVSNEPNFALAVFGPFLLPYIGLKYTSYYAIVALVITLLILRKSRRSSH